tara:strand:+ start:1720 stop:2151 length:432 start_codon:yes stop_codon:yes gene_type:complete
MNELNSDVLNHIFANINNTKDILNIRMVSKYFYSFFEKKIPFYIEGKKIGYILLKENIIWVNLKQKKLKEIIFKKYGNIKTKIYEHKIFKNKTDYNLPFNIEKRDYQNYFIKNTSIDLKKNEITQTTQSWHANFQGTPACIIS